MFIFGGLLVLAQGSALAPFIYTLFLGSGSPPCASSGISAFYHDSAAAA